MEDFAMNEMELIRKFCEKNEGCEGCPFYIDDCACYFRESYPTYWDFRTINAGIRELAALKDKVANNSASSNTTKATIPPCIHSLPNVDDSDGMTCGKCGGVVCCYQAEQ